MKRYESTLLNPVLVVALMHLCLMMTCGFYWIPGAQAFGSFVNQKNNNQERINHMRSRGTSPAWTASHSNSVVSSNMMRATRLSPRQGAGIITTASTKLKMAVGEMPFFAQMQPPPKEGTASITTRLPLGNIFESRDYIFSTATNVRSYEWTLKEAEELLDDLLDASNGILSRDVPKQDYELSQIVLVPMEWDRELYGLGNRYDVHDGQQRLVTLCLLFAALRESFAKDEGMDDTAMELAGMLNPPKVRKADLVRIELNKRDNEVLGHILKNDLKEMDHLNLKKMTKANQRIYENYKQFVARIDEMEKSEKVKFLDYLVENVYMLVCIPESATIARSLVMSQGKGKDNEPIDDFKGLVCFRLVSSSFGDYYC
jgi:Uncharacterized conserved protein